MSDALIQQPAGQSAVTVFTPPTPKQSVSGFRVPIPTDH